MVPISAVDVAKYDEHAKQIAQSEQLEDARDTDDPLMNRCKAHRSAKLQL